MVDTEDFGMGNPIADQRTHRSKESVIHKIGDAIEKMGEKLSRKGASKWGRKVEKMGDKVEHLSDRHSGNLP